MLAACNNNNENETETDEEAIENPTPEEILSSDKDADILITAGIVNTNAEDIEWVKKKTHCRR